MFDIFSSLFSLILLHKEVSSMSKQRNTNKRVMVDSTSIYSCQEKECLRLHASSSKMLNKIINTDIEFKKKIICHHCGTSWFICNLCNVRFIGKYYRNAERHFSNFHKKPSTTLSTRITTVKKRTITEINCSNDCNSSPSSVSFGDIDSYTNLYKTFTTSETHTAMIKHVKMHIF